MKYYFLTYGSEQGAEIPTEIEPDYNKVKVEFDLINDDDYFYYGLYEIDTDKLEINELERGGYINYE